MAKVLRNITPSNFVQWYKQDETEDAITYLNKDAFDLVKSMPIIISGEEYGYYLNFDKAYSFSFANLIPVVLNTDLTEKTLVDLFDLNQYSYQLFLKFQINFKLVGVYKLGLKDSISGDILFFSTDILFFDKFVDNSNLYTFSAKKNIGNFYYQSIENNVQKIRLGITNKMADYSQDIKQYRNSTNNKLRNTNFYIDKFFKLRVPYANESFCDAIIHLIQCCDFYINSIGVTTKSGLKLSNTDRQNLVFGEFEVYDNGSRLYFDLIDIISQNLSSNITYQQII